MQNNKNCENDDNDADLKYREPRGHYEKKGK